MLSRWLIGLVALTTLTASCTSGSERNPTSTTHLDAAVTTLDTPNTSAASSSSTVAPLTTTTTETRIATPPLELTETELLGLSETVHLGTGVSLVDSDIPVYRAPGLFVFPDGRIRLVYTVGGYDPALIEVVGETSIRMATCIDQSCSSVEIVELINISPFVMGVRNHNSQTSQRWVAFSQAGVPYFTWSAWINLPATDPRFDTESRIATCTDVDCSQVVSTELIHDYSVDGELVADQDPVSLATRPDDGVGIVYQFKTPTSSSIHYAECEPTLICSMVEATSTVSALQDRPADHVSLGYSPEDLPIITYSAGTDLWVVECLDTACSSEPSRPQIATFDVSAGPSAILTSPEGTYVLYEGFDTQLEIGAIWCPDVDCATARYTIVKAYESGSFAPFDATLADDHLPRIVWTTLDGFEFAACQDLACSSTETTATGIPAMALSITVMDEITVVGVVNDDGILAVRCESGICQP